jgi:WD40-like Beta Propeller Repeat
MLRRRRARDLAIVAAVVALGAVALTDALRDGPTTEEGRDGRAVTAATTEEREPSVTTAEEPQAGQASITATTDEVEASVPALPDGAASGLLAFTAPGACELRAVDLRSGQMLELPRLETSCELSAPRVGTRVAYTTVDDEGFSKKPFSILDLENPRASFDDYFGYFWVAWSPDGSKLAWCDGPRSGFELSRGPRPKRLHGCPGAYDPSGALAFVNGRQEIVVDGRPLLRARGPVWHLAWGVDGSLAVQVGGQFDRYEDGRLAGTASLLTPPSWWPPELAPDNCAALTVSGDVVRLTDLGCFQGEAPRTFHGVYADWSPDGKWIAVAEPDAIVLHRVVGDEASVRLEMAAGQLAWLSG